MTDQEPASPPLPKECTCGMYGEEPVAWGCFRDGKMVGWVPGPEDPDVSEFRLPEDTDVRMPLYVTPTHRTAGETIGGGELAVKALEWEEIHQPRSNEDTTTEIVGYEASTGFCTYYTIELCAGSVSVTGLDYEETFHDTEEEAKAAAQADFERRIRSALAPPPVEPVQGVTEALRSALQAMLGHYGPPLSVADMCEYDADHPISLARAALAAAPEGSGGAK